MRLAVRIALLIGALLTLLELFNALLDGTAHCSPYSAVLTLLALYNTLLADSVQCALPSWLVLRVALLAETSHCSPC
jgi:hypothetical protein